MGEITHSWNGTVLTITSDSGTSSCDLKGEKGDTGCRGAQGPAGIVIGGENVVSEKEYKLIRNIEITEDIKELYFDVDDNGEPFACGEFIITGTFQPSGGNQLYAGTKMWSWFSFIPQATNISNPRTVYIHLYHVVGGKWRTEMVQADNVSTVLTTSAGVNQNFLNDVGSEKISSLALYGGNSTFTVGTTLEIYGR